MANTTKAVITGDIVNSSLLSRGIREKLYPKLDSFIKSLGNGVKGEVNHGDWFRILLDDPAAALRIALKIKCYLKGITGSHAGLALKKNEKSLYKVDARIAIGTGKIDFVNERLGTSDGEAFQLSGRMLESIKTSHQTLAASLHDATTNSELSVILTLLDAIFAKTTPPQCQVIQRKLDGMKETAIAKELKIDQSAVNQRSTAGNWHAIEVAVNRFETLMKKT